MRCCWSFMLVKTVICSFPPDIAWFAIGAPLTRIIGTVFFPFSFILIYVLIVHFSMPIPFDRSVATLALFPLTSYHSWGPWKALCIALKEHQAAQFTPKLLPLASSLSTEGPCIVFGPVVRSLLLRVAAVDRRSLLLVPFFVAAILHSHFPTMFWLFFSLPWHVFPLFSTSLRCRLWSSRVAWSVSLFTIASFAQRSFYSWSTENKIENARWLLGPMLVAAWTTRDLYKIKARR